MRRNIVIRSVLLALLPTTSVSFTITLSLPQGHAILAAGQRSKTYPFHVSALLAANGDATTAGKTAEIGAGPVLREIERKEAKIVKKKEETMNNFDKAEELYEKLQVKKLEYLDGLKLAKNPPGGNFKETTVRSAVKAFMWRIVAGSVTFVTSLQFSGSLQTALSIVASDFLSKAMTMFIGERLMNKSSAGRNAVGDGVGRSLMKALLWRLFAICNTLTMAIFIAKDLSVASKIAGSDAIFKTALMFFYERIWARIQWGKEFSIEFSI